MGTTLVFTFAVVIFLIWAIARKIYKSNIQQTFNDVKERYNQYIVMMDRHTSVFDIGYMRRVAETNKLTFKDINYGHCIEIRLGKGKYKDSYFVVPYHNEAIAMIKDSYHVHANILKSDVHAAHLLFVNRVAAAQFDKNHPISRSEIDHIVSSIKTYNPKIHIYDFKIAYGLVMVRIAHESNIEDSIDQIVPYI